MKLIKYAAAVVLFTLSTGAYAQKTYYKSNQVPKELQTFANAMFPSNTIVYGKKKVKKGKTTYEVKLKDGTELEFDNRMSIREIESKTPLRNTIIPTKIMDYVASNYPNDAIMEWKQKSSYQEVKLQSHRKLYFDANGNLTRTKK